MTAVPAATPVTTPVDPITVATEVVPLLHVPPVVTSDNVVDVPAQMFLVPNIAEGPGVTVNEVVPTAELQYPPYPDAIGSFTPTRE